MTPSPQGTYLASTAFSTSKNNLATHLHFRTCNRMQALRSLRIRKSMDNILTFRFALPRFFSWGSEDYKRVIELPSVEIRNIETGSDRRTRRLKHLIKANHANFSVLYHDLRFHNHMDHVRLIPLLRNHLLYSQLQSRAFPLNIYRS